MAIKLALNQFNGGEISPQLEGRYDWDKYNHSAKLCKNFVPLIEGSLKRRGGSHFVTEVESLPIYYLTLNITAGSAPVYVVIDDDAIECELVDGVYTYSQACNYGDVITYTVQSVGYIEYTETVTMTEDKTKSISLLAVEDEATLTINAKPSVAVCMIDGIERSVITVEKGTTVSYEVSYKGETVTGTTTVNSDKTLNVTVQFYVLNIQGKTASGSFSCIDGLYKVIAVGGGGGAGGGSYGSDHKSTGGGGGSGAGYNGNMHLSGTYTYVAGSGGKGGGNARHADWAYDGTDGGATTISGVITLGGGKGGKHYTGKRGTGAAGAGGAATVYSATAVLETPIQGKSGSGNVGGKLSQLDTFGKGGDGVYKQSGGSGWEGFLQIRYLGDYNG